MASDQTTLEQPITAPIITIDPLSSAIIEMLARVRSSVVQVRSEGHGVGAGVIWRADGGVLTNFHVVAGGRGRIQVHLTDGRSLDATVVSHNRALDLALLKADADDLPAALVGDSTSLRVGELVFAVGHPWGRRDVVTAGIVSALGSVPVDGTGKSAQYIRSDVRLAPGNSGGPLLNAQGAVVGINAMIFGGDLGVAIPSHVATRWVAGLPSRRAYLGVGVEPVRFPVMRRDGGRVGRAAGLRVVDVVADGPGHRAGLHVGDVLLTAEGEAAVDAQTLLDSLANADGSVRLRVVREGSVHEVDVPLGG